MFDLILGIQLENAISKIKLDSLSHLRFIFYFLVGGMGVCEMWWNLVMLMNHKFTMTDLHLNLGTRNIMA